jgi:3-oxoacyl-[acyl-carrier-protein] synthase-3
MFIIEGLGNRMANKWGTAIRDQLNLTDEHVSFLLYHGENDETHFDRLEEALNSDLLTDAMADAIIKTAKVTARLYRLQLEELNNY